MTVKEQLEKLADNEGEMTIVPEGNDEQSLKAFQGEVRRLRALADEEIIEIVGKRTRKAVQANGTLIECVCASQQAAMSCGKRCAMSSHCQGGYLQSEVLYKALGAKVWL